MIKLQEKHLRKTFPYARCKRGEMVKKILVIGSLNMDVVIEMKRMPIVGETVLGTQMTYVPGGKGANQAYAAARLGGNVKMLGCVGEDDFGRIQRNNLTECGVDTDDLKVTGMQGTGMASIYVDECGDNTVVVVPGANAECNVSYLKEKDEALQECDYVILQMEICSDAIYHAINRAKELGKTIILNPAPMPDSFPDEIFPMLDYITPNETELMKLCGRGGDSVEDYAKGARQLLEKGVKNVLVTLGKKGALFVNQELEALFPARKVTAVDTTAAGDCFNGAFAVALAEGKKLEEAIIFAIAASSIAVTRNGAQTSMPTREETNQIMGKWSCDLKTL